MKKILICAIALFCLTTSTTAQTAKEVQKQRKEIYKMSKEELNQKATKDARKAAKEYKKEGWKAAPGALPLEKQLDRLYLMRMEVDADMYPKYLTGEAMSIAESYDAAKIQAMELARLNLAGQLQSEVTALVENSVGNQQMSREEAASITQTIMESKALFSQNLGRVLYPFALHLAASVGGEVDVRLAVLVFHLGQVGLRDDRAKLLRDELGLQTLKGDALSLFRRHVLGRHVGVFSTPRLHPLSKAADGEHPTDQYG